MASLQDHVDAQRQLQKDKKNFLQENKKQVRQNQNKLAEKEKGDFEKKSVLRKRIVSSTETKQEGQNESMSNSGPSTSIPYTLTSKTGAAIDVKNEGCQTEMCYDNVLTKDILKLNLDTHAGDKQQAANGANESSLKNNAEMKSEVAKSSDNPKKHAVNFLKQNTIKAAQASRVQRSKPDPTKAPPNYKKGVLPKKFGGTQV